MNICVVGVGYVGLVTGACLSDFGMNVTCVDNNCGKIEDLKAGVVPLYEKGLQELVEKNVNAGRLAFTDDLKHSVRHSEVIFVTVGTPSKDNGEIDLSCLRAGTQDIAEVMDSYRLIVIKSTVPVGTAKQVEKTLRESQKYPVEFDVVSNPEFLRQGSAVEDFTHPQRVIIGTLSQRALDILMRIYSPFREKQIPFVFCDNETAEMIKYASNGFLAMKISFANEMANLCDRLGIDVHQVTRAMGLDRRIGPEFLSPGPGFGGSCLPKDVWGLVKIAEKAGYDFKLCRCVAEVNHRQKESVVGKAKRLMGGVDKKTIGILGLSFKAGTDDIRDSPSLVVIKQLLRENAEVRAFDPVAIERAREEFPSLYFGATAYDAANGCDCLMVLTEWDQFRNVDWERIKESMQSPNLIDTRNLCDPTRMQQIGFNYVGMGHQALSIASLASGEHSGG